MSRLRLSVAETSEAGRLSGKQRAQEPNVLKFRLPNYPYHVGTIVLGYVGYLDPLETVRLPIPVAERALRSQQLSFAWT